MRITVDMIMAYGPCSSYPRSRVEELWVGRGSLSAAEMRALAIPPRDLMYAWLQLLAHGGQLPTVVKLARTFAEKAKNKAAAEAAEAAEAAGWAAARAARAARAAEWAAARAARAARAAAMAEAETAWAADAWAEDAYKNEYQALLDLVQAEIEAWT